MHAATFTRRFSAAHRVAEDPGACHRIHGHNYEAEITVRCNALDTAGFVLPADAVKEVVDRKYDHRLILDAEDRVCIKFNDGVEWDQHDAHIAREWIVRVPFVPSTEHLAEKIAWDVADACLAHHESVDSIDVTVVLRETPTIQAQYVASYRKPAEPKPLEERFLGTAS
jgi:6-pyruvoyl-tetrahydropterin synthase